MTTTTAAASNGTTGTTASEATGQKDKPFGLAKVREAETYHNASILDNAVSEAERLSTAIHRAVSDAYFTDVRKDKTKDTGLTATQTAESPQIQAKAREVLNCLQAAEDYVQRLLVNTYRYDCCDESPF
jgi:hypothetical protein